MRNMRNINYLMQMIWGGKLDGFAKTKRLEGET